MRGVLDAVAVEQGLDLGAQRHEWGGARALRTPIAAQVRSERNQPGLGRGIYRQWASINR
jgi:hypothetical protein